MGFERARKTAGRELEGRQIETGMQLTLIDYSVSYFKMIAKKPLPPKRGGKFVQIRSEVTEYLVLSPAELSSFHANIVERFCLLHKLEGRYISARKDDFQIDDDDWHIVGGGKWVIDETAKLLSLFDKSGTYGEFDGHRLKERLKTVEALRGYEVKIHGK